jgi:uncharacterized protein (DUF488 family)
MTQYVYTIGYSGRKMHEIKAIADRLEAVIFDIRFSPRSRAPMWNKSSFERELGRRYQHVKAFGNKNYKGGPIELVDFEAGVERIQASGRPVILMCACKNPAICHRTNIRRRLQALGFQVEEASSARPASPNTQPRLL